MTSPPLPTTASTSTPTAGTALTNNENEAPPSISIDSLSLPALSITSPMQSPIVNPNPPSAPILTPAPNPPSSAPTQNSVLQRSASSSHRSHPGTPGGVKVPPGLVAKMAGMTKRKDNLNSSASIPHNQRLDPMAFMPNNRISSALTTPSPCSPSSILSPSSMPANRRMKPTMKLGDLQPPTSNQNNRPKFLSVSGPASSTPFANFSKIVDPSGRLNFGGKAILHSHGVDFSNGSSFSINMSELNLLEELGKGNYGTVQKVFHKPTKVVMAMKEIRLELDDSKLKAILTELDILHRATSSTIVEFYGAFFIESCVYYCMEYMDGGSLDKLAGADVPEPVLARVTGRVVEGLRFLKDELQIIHRGQLERSLAKTNIGCQSYMAPERIQGEQTGSANTYTVSSDVWSLGISIIEFAIGHYPYPPETYQNIFAQLSAIVHGQSPTLPGEIYSPVAQDFVNRCLQKNPKDRPTYNELLDHPFLRDEAKNSVDMVPWVANAIQQVKK